MGVNTSGESLYQRVHQQRLETLRKGWNFHSCDGSVTFEFNLLLFVAPFLSFDLLLTLWALLFQNLFHVDAQLGFYLFLKLRWRHSPELDFWKLVCRTALESFQFVMHNQVCNFVEGITLDQTARRCLPLQSRVFLHVLHSFLRRTHLHLRLHLLNFPTAAWDPSRSAPKWQSLSCCEKPFLSFQINWHPKINLHIFCSVIPQVSLLLIRNSIIVACYLWTFI